jgi:hypothetical protein
MFSPHLPIPEASRPSLLGRVRARGARLREPSWQELAQSLFFIVESIDDYLYTY